MLLAGPKRRGLSSVYAMPLELYLGLRSARNSFISGSMSPVGGDIPGIGACVARELFWSISQDLRQVTL